MKWYYVEAGRQAGPVDDAGLGALVASGKVRAETLVWREGMANWQAYREIQAAIPGAPAATGQGAAATGGSAAGAEAVCAQCGGVFPINDTIRLGDARVCASCKPVFVQRMREGVDVSGAGELRYAGFWIRVAAYLVDSLILGAVNFIVVIFLGLAIPLFIVRSAPGAPASSPSPFLLLIVLFFYFLMLAIPACYETFMIGRYGATLGKMACRIRVVRADGARVSYLLALGRFFSKIVSALICYVGFLMAGWDVEKRALHDHMCSTRVVCR